MNTEFRALVVEQNEAGEYTASLEHKTIDDLPSGDVVIRVQYSSLNYKDALCMSGTPGITKNYPHTPGIDAAGTILSGSADGAGEGDEVIVTGYDLGMNTAGGYGEYIRVPAEWVVKKPEQLSLRQAMILGTAGFTAAQCVDRLLRNITPDSGRVMVTGATGGVGSLGIALLHKIGFTVDALTGKGDESGFLAGLGADGIISRQEFDDQDKRPLLRGTHSGGLDTVGGDILAKMLKIINPLGTITCCGNAASPKLNTNVYPFILRGIELIGISSQDCPMAWRKQIWQKLSKEWRLDILESITTEIGLEDLPARAAEMRAGGVSGRTLVKVA